jgi:glycerol uptake facilitator-like aquaporin
VTVVRLPRRLFAEAIGTALLLATVVGSGIMAERLAGGNVALALLANTMATGAALFGLILMFAPVSGAHFNPVVTLIAILDRDLSVAEGLGYGLVQVVAALAGVALAHLMFDFATLFSASQKMRTGWGQWLSEGIATFGLVLVIRLVGPRGLPVTAAAVACWIVAAYWFTASTSFANPAVTLARAASDTFAGIRPADAPAFILAQIAGGVVAWFAARAVAPPPSARGIR